MNLYLIWKYKYWIAIAVLSFICLGQLAYTNYLGGELNKAEAKYKTELAISQASTEKAKAEAAAKEKQWSEQLLKVEQNYNVKIKKVMSDTTRAQSAADSLSKQLSEAKRNLFKATRETIIKYIIIQSDVFEQCTTEYREMARSCDAERIDKEKLIEAWPSN